MKANLAVLTLSLAALQGCVSQERISLATQACEKDGGTAYVEEVFGGFECVSARQQKRLERLELACVSAGGTVDYDSKGKYVNCEKKSSVNVNVNNDSWPITGMETICLTQRCRDRQK